MNFRVSETTASSNFISRVNSQRSRLNTLQEQLASGKRINRPSDDPSGAEAVIDLQTSQKEIGQFQRSAQSASEKLTAADDALNGFLTMLERVQTLNAQGLSDTGTQQTRDYVATELSTMQARFLRTANLKNGDDYLFGGTRQNAPPFDPATGLPSATPSTAQHMQIEPGANAIAVGVTAESFFSDATSNIFTDLTTAIAALHGTGDAAADRLTLENTMTRLGVYRDLANTAQATVGVNMNVTEIAMENLGSNSLTIQERISTVEDADFAKTAVDLSDTQRGLDATLQVIAKGRRSLFDFLG